MKSCRALADEMGVLDKVTFTGMLPKTEWIELSQNFDIFINTTNLESFGVSVIEAAACGLPVVTTNVGGIPYLLNKDNSIIIEPGDYIALSEAIVKLITDEEFANMISNNARKFAEDLDWVNIINKWDALLCQL